MTAITPGERLFARCAHAPNSRGYCGPRTTELEAVALGGTGDVLAAARRFSGVWVYLDLAAQQLGRDDPLALDLVQAYWLGTPPPPGFARPAFARDLVQRIANQAGSYWKYLTPELEAEVVPTHGFHVFGVYPWSRLLHRGAPEPLMVLESCRLTPARVLAVSGAGPGDRLLVAARPLECVDGELRLRAERERWVEYTLGGGTFFDAPPRVGDWVALHWDFACTALTAAQAAALEADTVEQVRCVNLRAEA
ncbi:hypothetical protein JT358_08250 [Micrococcales bacterium 31B]|nr:hypothetical protein [Micrococcales bacterium 31B]